MILIAGWQRCHPADVAERSSDLDLRCRQCVCSMRACRSRSGEAEISTEHGRCLQRRSAPNLIPKSMTRFSPELVALFALVFLLVGAPIIEAVPLRAIRGRSLARVGTRPARDFRDGQNFHRSHLGRTRRQRIDHRRQQDQLSVAAAHTIVSQPRGRRDTVRRNCRRRATSVAGHTRRRGDGICGVWWVVVIELAWQLLQFWWLGGVGMLTVWLRSRSSPCRS